MVDVKVSGVVAVSESVKWWGWRLVALAVLALAGLAGLVSIWLVLSNPRLAVVIGLTIFLTLAAAWRLLLGGPAAKLWPYALALPVLLVALVVEILKFVGNRSNVKALMVLIVLVAAASGLLGWLRRRYRREPALRPIAGGGRAFLIVNPKSGSGRAIKSRIPMLASARGIHVLQLESGGSLTALVDQAVDSGATVLGISGGDGSIGVAAEAAMRRDIPLVVLPGGTRCHFARDIGLDPGNMADSLRQFEGREVRIDAAEINGRVFVNNASFGIYADIVRQPGYRERKLQSAVGTLRRGASAGSTYPLKFTDGGGKVRKRAVLVLVGVNRYETMHLMELGSRKRLDEGILQMTALYRLDHSFLKEMAGVVRLNRPEGQRAELAQWVGTEFMIAGKGETMQAGVDGELVGLESPVRLRILPGALRLMVPPEGVQGRRSVGRVLGNVRDFAWRGRSPHA